MDVIVENMTLGYGGDIVIEDLSLNIAQGETIVLLGKSGCGKTSTMRSIAGLESPMGGKITIGDNVVFDSVKRINVAPNKRRVGMVFQSYAVWPHRTVLENVRFSLDVRKVPRKKANDSAMKVLEMVGLGQMAERSASKLSGGQMQRVALARSLAMEPRVLLLDEPLSNLDAVLRDDLRIELKKVQQELGLTSVYVTHDQSEALALADRIAIMDGGKIIQFGSPEEIYRAPADARIARFLGISNAFAAQPTSPGIFEINESVSVALAGQASGDTVCIRPDDFSVVAIDEAKPHPINAWEGRVEVSIYQGRTVRAQVRLQGGLVLDVVAGMEGYVPHVGDRVWVTVDPARVMALPEES